MCWTRTKVDGIYANKNNIWLSEGITQAGGVEGGRAGFGLFTLLAGWTAKPTGDQLKWDVNLEKHRGSASSGLVIKMMIIIIAIVVMLAASDCRQASLVCLSATRRGSTLG